MYVGPIPIKIYTKISKKVRVAAFIFKRNDRINTVSMGGDDGYCAVAKKVERDTKSPSSIGNLRHKLENILVIG